MLRKFTPKRSQSKPQSLFSKNTFAKKASPVRPFAASSSVSRLNINNYAKNNLGQHLSKRFLNTAKPTHKFQMAAKMSSSLLSTIKKPNFSSGLTRKFSSSEVPDLSSFTGVGRLNHVAIAVPNLANSSKLYKDVMGAQVSAPIDIPEHGVTTVFVDLGNTKLELLHPLGQKSPIQNFLDKKPGGGIHHICLEVDDIKAALAQMKQNDVKVIDPEPKIGAHGKPVVFLHPKGLDGVLLELEQK